MVIVIAKVKVKPGKEDEFAAAARKMVAHVKAQEPGTLTYTLNQSTADKTDFVFYEVYRDPEAFAAHAGSEVMQEFGRSLGGVVAGRPEMAMYDEIDGKR
jgi:quinol monooxygenase YgiN